MKNVNNKQENLDEMDKITKKYNFKTDLEEQEYQITLRSLKN